MAAHSTTRALYADYRGALYQVRRDSDGRTLDIAVVAPSAMPVPDAGGYANAAAQDAFCADALCVITRIYDQSPKGNHLYQAPPGTFPGPAKGGFNTLPIADMAPVTLRGHKVYGAFIMPGMGFRNNDAAGLAINDEPEGIYYVIDGTHFSSGCCFDYGNASTNGRAVGTGTMETTYFGTATAWGKGAGPGPWIMADMEAGLFSGYGAKENAGSPTIDSWRFVTAMVNGGGGNQWDLRGGNAQQGGLTTFYSGVRPGTPGSSDYFPMNRKGAVLLGNGGDNGNGSAGTFYEGVMTSGYPTQAAIDAVQANIVAARYAQQRLGLSRMAGFSPGETRQAVLTFTNTTQASVTGVRLGVALPAGWRAVVAGTRSRTKVFSEPVVAGATVSATFEVTASGRPGAGYLTGRAEWNEAGRPAQADTTQARVRSAPAVRINEIFLAMGTGQFIELFNAGTGEVDLSGWSLISTPGQWAPVTLATLPKRIRLQGGARYLLALAGSGLAAPARAGDTVINVRSTADYAVGQQITVEGESRTINGIGTAASPATTVFIPVSTGPWLDFPAGTTRLPVTHTAGFRVGERISIDLGGQHEIATVTEVGSAATQTTLSTAAHAGDNRLSLASATVAAGDTLTVDTGARKELVVVRSVEQGGVALVGPLKLDHMNGVDVSSPGTGIAFSPATKFPHGSGDAMQALGSGITLDRALAAGHGVGAPVTSAGSSSAYRGPPAPDQWFGGVLSPRAGSLALINARGVVVDAVVYGSRQSSSSANGTITSPELATLESSQRQGGSIAVVPPLPRPGRGGAPVAAVEAPPARSVGRVHDGRDTDDLAADFQLQVPTPGASNQKAD